MQWRVRSGQDRGIDANETGAAGTRFNGGAVARRKIRRIQQIRATESLRGGVGDTAKADHDRQRANPRGDVAQAGRNAARAACQSAARCFGGSQTGLHKFKRYFHFGAESFLLARQASRAVAGSRSTVNGRPFFQTAGAALGEVIGAIEDHLTKNLKESGAEARKLLACVAPDRRESALSCQDGCRRHLPERQTAGGPAVGTWERHP